jgi:arsenite methyltransferase
VAWLKNRPYNARAADMWQPWSLLALRCAHFEWTATQGGMGYIGHGTLKGALP